MQDWEKCFDTPAPLKKLQTAACLSQTLSFNLYWYKNLKAFWNGCRCFVFSISFFSNSDRTEKCTIARVLTAKFHVTLSIEVEFYARFPILHLFISFLEGNHSTEWSFWLTATTVGMLFRAGGAWNQTIVLKVQLVLLEESTGKCFLFNNSSL